MLELVALLFEEDPPSFSNEERDRVTRSASDRVKMLASSSLAENKSEAVRIYRKETGASLRDSLRAIELLASYSK